MNNDMSLSGTLGALRIANPDDGDSTSPSPSPISHHTSTNKTSHTADSPQGINSPSSQARASFEPSARAPPAVYVPRDVHDLHEFDQRASASDARNPNVHGLQPELDQSVSIQSQPITQTRNGPSRHNSRHNPPTPQVPYTPTSPYPVETGPPPRSADAWQEKGAAIATRTSLDAEGRPVSRVIKKGVKDFNFGRTLGEGSYSTVLAATDRHTNREYAVKVLDKRHIIKEKKVKYVSIEKDTLNRLTDHPGIVRLYYTFQDERSLYFVLDLATGGELLGVLKRYGTFDQECTRFYAAQILDSISYMHSRGVIHRDLKPENVLLDTSMHTKITDFGTAKILNVRPEPKSVPADSGDATDVLTAGLHEHRADSFVGTAEYVSPELLTDKNACKASDLWAFGCIVYQLLVGRPPFKAGNEYLTFQKIVALDYQFPPNFPPSARDLIERLLVLDPEKRPTIKQIQSHEFFTGTRWGKGLWRHKAPRLKPYVPPESAPIRLNDDPTQAQTPTDPVEATSKPQPRAFTELPPPSQLDIDWSPVLTRSNERIVKLGNLDVTTGAGQHEIPKAGEEKESKFSKLFGSNNLKKKQRLVIVTSTARIIVVAAGGEDKKVKLEIPLMGPDISYSAFQDTKGLTAFCVETVSFVGTIDKTITDSRSVTSTTSLTILVRRVLIQPAPNIILQNGWRALSEQKTWLPHMPTRRQTLTARQVFLVL